MSCTHVLLAADVLISIKTAKGQSPSHCGGCQGVVITETRRPAVFFLSALKRFSAPNKMWT